MRNYRFLIILLLLVAMTTKMKAQIDWANWMSKVPNNTLLCNMSIPVAHDAATHACSSANFFTKDQCLDEKALFDMGVRGFDLRLGFDQHMIHGSVPDWAVTTTQVVGGIFTVGISAIAGWIDQKTCDKGVVQLESYEDEIKNHLPDLDPESRECLFLFITDDGHWDNSNTLMHKSFDHFVSLLTSKYDKAQFIGFKPNLTMRDLRGRVMLIFKSPDAQVDYKKICQEHCIPAVYQSGGKFYDIDDLIENPNNPKKTASYLSQGKWEVSNADELMQSVNAETKNYWAHFDKDPDNNEHLFFYCGVNGYSLPFGGISVAGDDHTGSEDTDFGSNHRAVKLFSTTTRPLGFVGFDFCGTNSYMGYDTFGEDLLHTIVQHNSIAKRFFRELKVFAGDELADVEKKLQNDGYERVTEDLNRGVGGDYICLGAKYTSDADHAIQNIICVNYKKKSNRPNNTFVGPKDKKLWYLAPYEHVTDPKTIWSGDLNHNAGGDYLYLYYSLPEPGESWILTALEQKDDDKKCNNAVNMYDYDDGKYTSNGVADFNKGIRDFDDVFLNRLTHTHGTVQKLVPTTDMTHHLVCSECGARAKNENDLHHRIVVTKGNVDHVTCSDCDLYVTYDHISDTFDENGFGVCHAIPHPGKTSECYQPATEIDGVYHIQNAGQLYWFANRVNAGDLDANAILDADICVNKDITVGEDKLHIWVPIANNTDLAAYKLDKDQQDALDASFDDGLGFHGFFDGNGHIISGLYVKGNSQTDVSGLFGYVRGGMISRLGIENSYFESSTSNQYISYVGSFAGYAENTVLSNVYSKATIKAQRETDAAGGIAGKLKNSKVGNSFFSGNLDAKYKGSLSHSMDDSSKNDTKDFYALSNESGLDGSSDYYVNKDVFESGAICASLNSSTTPGIYFWNQPLDANNQLTGTPTFTKTGALGVPALYNGDRKYINLTYDKNVENSYACDAIDLTEGEYAMPVDFTAKNASYTRSSYKQGKWGTLMLPFSVKSTDDLPLFTLTGVGKENDQDVYVFEEIDLLDACTPGIFFAQKVQDGKVAADGSVVGAVTFAAVDNVLVKNSLDADKKEKQSYTLQCNNEWTMYGTFKNQTIKQDKEDYTKYTLKDGTKISNAVPGSSVSKITPYRAWFERLYKETEHGWDGIDDLILDASELDVPIYDLSGRIINSTGKGKIVIRNGKKLIKQ